MLPGLMIPDFSAAMWPLVGPANSLWSMPMLVMTATCASHTLVASQRPSSPTSTTATSTARSANQRNAAAVVVSKYDGRTPVSISRSATAAICSANSSSLIGSPLRLIRSFEPLEVRAGVRADGQPVRHQQTGDHLRRRALAVGAGDVDDRVGELRIAHRRDDRLHPLERRRLDAPGLVVVGVGVEVRQRVGVGHRPCI